MCRLEELLKQAFYFGVTEQIVECAYYAIKSGANPNLFVSTSDGIYDVSKMIVLLGIFKTFLKFVNEFDLDLETSERFYYSLFNSAFICGNIDIIQWFLSSKKVSSQTIQKSLEQLCNSTEKSDGKLIKLSKLLIEHGADLLQKTFMGESLTELASTTRGKDNPFAKFIRHETEILKEEKGNWLCKYLGKVDTQEDLTKKLAMVIEENKQLKEEFSTRKKINMKL